MSDRILASYLLYSAWAEVDPTGALEHANGLGWAGAFVKPTILQKLGRQRSRQCGELL